MVTLPKKYAYLLADGVPKVIAEAVQLFGTREIVGPQSNPQILAWAKEVGLQRDYSADEIPWCGLFAAVVVDRAGYIPARIALRAKDWLNWGTKVTTPMLGDVVVFGRDGGGHVGFYVGETATHYAVLGGNQGNCVSVALFPKKSTAFPFLGARRSPWKIGQPASVKQVLLNDAGPVAATTVV